LFQIKLHTGTLDCNVVSANTTGCGIKKYPLNLFEQPLAILSPNFTRLLRVYSLL